MKSSGRKYFNVRVYGLLFHEGAVLLSDEFINGREITKFPGGGLEFGEGTRECIVREFQEELKLKIEPANHFYTTDFFVASSFNPSAQVVSVYYEVTSQNSATIVTAHRKFDFTTKKEGAQSFRWRQLNEISEDDFTFSIDKKVARLLRDRHEALSINHQNTNP
jgi:8-oxo-dGTP diphosphatase